MYTTIKQMNNLLQHNDIIHIVNNKHTYLSQLTQPYLHFVDYDTHDKSHININTFISQKKGR